MDRQEHPFVHLGTIVREWGRIGVIGFGGPSAHVSLFRKLCVEKKQWLTTAEFEDAIAATSFLPGPASTQLAIFFAWRLRRRRGAVIGGLSFIVPGLVMILVLSALFLADHPPLWVAGAAAGAGAAVPAVALQAASTLAPASWRRAGNRRAPRVRWRLYFTAAAVAAATIGPYLVLVLLACGLTEVIARQDWRRHPPQSALTFVTPLLLPIGSVSGLPAVAWVALKVGALSYGGGFVIIPLMQHDAVQTYRWMTNSQFLNAVALGQITPGPVVHTVAAVGYAAAGVGGALLAALIAFAPSFLVVIAGGAHFDRLRTSRQAQAFLIGAGGAAIGAITGSTIPLTFALSALWQGGVLALALLWVLALRRGIVTAITGAALFGTMAPLAGAPISR